MGSIERIHPELNPEDIPPSTAPAEEIEKMKLEGRVVPFKKAERQLLNKQKFWEKKQATEKESPDQKGAERLKEYRSLTWEYGCGIDVEPRWCVWGYGLDRGRGVLFWIKPMPDDELIAHRIAKLINELGGKARAEKTEWNETLKGTAVYEKNSTLDL